MAPQNYKPEEIIEMFDYHKSAWSTYHSHCQEINDYLLPFRANFTGSDIPGEKKMAKIFDGLPTTAAMVLVAGLNSLLTNKSMPWLKFKVHEDEYMEDEEILIWLEWLEKRFYGVFASSNFYMEKYEQDIDIVGYGTGCLYMEADFKNIGYFENVPTGNYYFSENHQKQVDTVFRNLNMTARQVLQDFGQASDEITEAAKDPRRKNTVFEIVHGVYPRSDLQWGKKDSLNMPWASVYVERKSKEKLREGGYREFPFACPRWLKMDNETMGRSQAMLALPDIKMLYEMKKTNWQAAVKKIDPPLFITEEAVVNSLKTTPHGLNLIRADKPSDKIFALPTPGDVGLGLDMQKEVREQIRETFFNHIMQVLASTDPKKRMSATEVLARIEEGQRTLGPGPIERLMKEQLTPVIDWLFAQMLRRGLYVPPALSGKHIDIDYISPLAQAQKRVDAEAIGRTMGFISPLAGLQPDILDNYDFDFLARHVADTQGMPLRALKPQKLVAQIRDQRAKKAQVQEAIGAAKDLAPALQRTTKKIEPGSPLDLVMGGASGGLEPPSE